METTALSCSVLLALVTPCKKHDKLGVVRLVSLGHLLDVRGKRRGKERKVASKLQPVTKTGDASSTEVYTQRYPSSELVT